MYIVAPAHEYDDCNSGLEWIVLAVITVPILKLVGMHSKAYKG